jgi:nucleoside 2-deoxyribosyltransferase
MERDFIILISVLVAIFAALLGFLMVFFRNIRESFYDREMNRTEMEKLRAMLEQRIYEITNRLLSTEDRWKDVQHLLISSQKAIDFQPETKRVILSDFLKNMGVTETDAVIDRELIFVLTPFHHAQDKEFQAIKEVCTQVGLKCFRGDEEYVPDNILSHILRLVARARIVIANINGRNPNVFYELGIAQAMGKPTILISQSLTDAPFDVQSKKIILYQDIDDLKEKLKEELTKTLVKI